MLNFSIAYGKTAHGLSKDWKTSLKEAEETVERWYADRPEVRRGWGAAGRQSGVGWVGMGWSGCVAGKCGLAAWAGKCELAGWGLLGIAAQLSHLAGCR